MLSPLSRCRVPLTVLLGVVTLGCVSAQPLASVGRGTVRARGDSGDAQALAASSEAALAAVGRHLGLSTPAAALEVYLFDSRWDMRRYLWRHCPEQSGKAAACFAAGGGYVVTVVKTSKPDETERLLRHEITHFLLASHYRDLPRWVDEGLAQYLEVDPAQAREDKRREFRERRTPRSEKALLELVSLPARKPLRDGQYLLSWALVSFLVQRDRQGMDRVRSYLARVEDDGRAVECFEAVFGRREELGPLWEAYLAREGLARSAARDRAESGKAAPGR